ncbi:hypothetical protein TNCV_3850871 [Trichonephila clavipes]|nr:hypothetical protein TNCV_3850871 [Trichonephila clavipes]
MCRRWSQLVGQAHPTHALLDASPVRMLASPYGGYPLNKGILLRWYVALSNESPARIRLQAKAGLVEKHDPNPLLHYAQNAWYLLQANHTLQCFVVSGTHLTSLSLDIYTRNGQTLARVPFVARDTIF